MNKADQWRAKSRAAAAGEAVELSLPSGMVVKARRPQPEALAMMGMLPGNLTARTIESSASEGTSVLELVSSMRELLIYCVIEPGISMKPGPEEVHPREISMADVNFILFWALRREEADRLATFRAKPEDGGADSVREDMARQTFPTPRYPRSDAGAGSGPGSNIHLEPFTE